MMQWNEQGCNGETHVNTTMAVTWFIFQYGRWLTKPLGSHRPSSHSKLSLHAQELLLDLGRR